MPASLAAAAAPGQQSTPDLEAQVAALLRRADALHACQGLSPETYAFWRGYAKGLRDLLNGTGAALSSKDALFAQQAPCAAQAAGAGLPVDVEIDALVDVPQRLSTQRAEVAGDGVAGLQLNAVEQLENSELAPFVLNDEHAVAAVDAHDGASCHSPLSVDVERAV